MSDPSEFPEEGEWLSLPAPEVSPGFVDGVVERLRAEGLVGDAVERDDVMLPAALLAAWSPPPPSEGFVDDTLARWRQERAQPLSQILGRHTVPTASSDFVERTLAALRAIGTVRRRPVLLRTPAARGVAVAAAAVVLVGLLWWLLPGKPTVQRLPVERWARLQSVTAEPLAGDLAALTVHGLDLPAADPALELDAVAREGR